MSSRNAKKASIFFARLPQFDDLRLVTLRILTGTSQSISDFAEQIWRTREVIFLTKGRILASPQAFNKHVFTAVARAEDLDSEELKQVFQSLNLEIIKRNALSKSGFQECLKYTLEALLAPDWNKVQNYFIQGRDFLINSGSMNAVKLHVVITETHLQLTVTPMGLSWRPNSMDDLGVPWTAQQKFLNPKGKKPPVIGKAMIKCPMVHVLPSFRTGHVLSIHREIPPGAPFDSLDALRKYWKNTYGYRLSDIPPTYVNVSFRTGGGVGTAMAYPAICIRTKPPVFQPRVDEMGIKFLIMKDIIRKLSQAGGVCGYELGFSTQPMTPVPDLIQSSHLTSILNEGVNLTQTPVPTIPLTSVTNRKSPLAPTGFSVHNNGVGKPQVEAKSEETRDAGPVENILATSTIPSATSTIPSENQKNASQEPSEEATTAEESPPQEGNMRLFFKPKKPRSFVPGAAKRALPMMPPPRTAKIARTARTTGSPKKVAKFAGRMAKVSAPKQHVLLSQKPSVDKPSEESSAASSVTTQPPVVGLQKPTFPLVGHDTLVSPVVTTQQPMASHAQQPLLKHVKQPMFIHVQQPALKHAQQPMLTQAQQPALKHAQQPMLIHAQQPALKHAQQPVLIHAQQPALKYAQQPMLTQAVPHHIPKTNKSSSNATPVPSRFSREALQEIALNQHWHKVTVNDLKLWLRQQSVGVTAKDKKADLIEKTKKALNVEATP